jgi:hypothetical protein
LKLNGGQSLAAAANLEAAMLRSTEAGRGRHCNTFSMLLYFEAAAAPEGKKKTILKRLPVISREHFRKTRTNFFYKHLFGKKIISQSQRY